MFLFRLCLRGNTQYPLTKTRMIFKFSNFNKELNWTFNTCTNLPA